MRFESQVRFDRRFRLGSSVVLLLLIGLVQVAGYYFAGATVRSDGGLAIAQPDTLLYCQAARRVAEGHPFSYSEGTRASTGTTSVAHPFVLAVPYALGLRGDRLLVAGFVLNAAFYLLFLWGWSAVIRRKLSDPTARTLAMVLLGLSSQPAYCALAQSDIGLWLAASAGLAAGLATGRAWLYAPLLLAGPWIRPEGAVFALAWAMVAFVRRRGRALAVAAIVSAAGVFALNWALTGSCQFSSVARKGYFLNYGFADAIVLTAGDALAMAKALFLGLPLNAPRDYYAMPLLAAALMWLGVLAHDWRRNFDGHVVVWLLASAGGFATVAMSGWQNTNMDRYVAWFMPLCTLFAAEGAAAASRWVAERTQSVVRHLPAALLVAFALCAAPVQIAAFHVACVQADAARAFAVQCERTMTQNSSVGMLGGCGAAYAFSPRRVAHISGIYSPEFPNADIPGAFETLKHCPETRFYYWFSDRTVQPAFAPAGVWKALAEDILAGPRHLALQKAVWEPLDAAARVPTALAPGLTCRARVDVGYAPDERAADYEPLTVYDQPEFAPFVESGKLDDREIVESGRVLLGGDEMSVALEPGLKVTVVMRTRARATAVRALAFGSVGGEYVFGGTQELHLEVDGEEVSHVSYKVGDEGFTDVAFEIPAARIRKDVTRVGLHGEHIACGYWFFQ